MKRLVVAVLLFVTTGVGFGFQVSGGWIKYNSPDGRYSVLIPTQPKLTTQEQVS